MSYTINDSIIFLLKAAIQKRKELSKNSFKNYAKVIIIFKPHRKPFNPESSQFSN